MVSAKLALLSLVLVAGEAAATAVVSRHNFFRSFALKARQGTTIDPSDIPPQCQSVCATPVTDLNGCSTDPTQCTALCSNTVMKGLADCLSCTNAAAGGDASDTEQAQTDLDQLEASCAEAGDPVNSFTVSGPSGEPTGSATAGDGSSDAFPTGASSTSQQVFFSSSGASGAATPANTATKNVVTAGASSNAAGAGTTAGAQSSAGAGNTQTQTAAGAGATTPTGLKGGSAHAFGSVSVAAAFGAAFMLALNL